uniref:Uncharacterized protein n=1 Tax=Anguilla anguilla TaxID=7936 RepID=A0A0E9VVI1_ANGAN
MWVFHMKLYCTFMGHCIRYNYLVLGMTPVCLQDILNYLEHGLVLETFLRDFGPC